MPTLLESRESKILYAALLNAATKADTLGGIVNEPGYQIRRSLSTLQKNGTAVPYTLINQFLLGWMKIGVYFTFVSTSIEEIKEVIEKLIGYQQVVSLIELFGPYQYFISVNAKNIIEFEEFMGIICEEIPKLRIDENISIRRSLTLFKRKYLNPQQLDTHYLSYSYTKQVVELDDISVRVLNAIITLGGLPNGPAIAEITGVTNTTVHNKIKDLEAKGIIVGYSYSIDPFKIGYHPYDLLIKTSTRNSSFKKEFFDFCSSHLFVVGLTECSGQWQYEVRVETESPAHATSISQEINSKFGQYINKIDTVSICKEIKYMRTPAIKNDAEKLAHPNRKAQD